MELNKTGAYINYTQLTQGGDSIFTDEAPTSRDLHEFNIWTLEEATDKYFFLKSKGFWTLLYNQNLHTEPIIQVLLSFNKENQDNFKTRERE